MKKFIAVAGNIGVGKSTLTQLLSDTLGWEPFYEAVSDNPYLADFYGDMTRYAFHSQIFFLSRRLRHHRRLLDFPNSVVQDRSVYEDAEIFARGLFEQGFMSSDEWSLYQRLYAELLHSPAARPPRLLVYLHGPLDVIIDRIAVRGRPKEKDTSVEYWTALHDRYERWIEEFNHCPILALDVRDYDLVANAEAVEEIAGRVRVQLEGELPQTELWPALPRKHAFA